MERGETKAPAEEAAGTDDRSVAIDEGQPLPVGRPPTARYVETAGAEIPAMAPSSSVPTAVGSIRSTEGSANGVWVKWVVRRSGRSRARSEPIRDRW